jgi:hypothetical protein
MTGNNSGALLLTLFGKRMSAVGDGNDPFTVEARLCALCRTAMGKKALRFMAVRTSLR